MAKFHRLFAIDTNTQTINGRIVSVAAITECRLKLVGDEMIIETGMHGGYEFHGIKEKQENFAWLLLIGAITTSTGYSESDSYGIITDSDLGQHTAYNSKEKPFFGDIKLPYNFTLIYAYGSGRAICNYVIKACDKLSARILKKFKTGELSTGDALEIRDSPCTHFRRFDNSNETFLKQGWFPLAQLYPANPAK